MWPHRRSNQRAHYGDVYMASSRAGKVSTTTLLIAEPGRGPLRGFLLQNSEECPLLRCLSPVGHVSLCADFRQSGIALMGRLEGCGPPEFRASTLAPDVPYIHVRHIRGAFLAFRGGGAPGGEAGGPSTALALGDDAEIQGRCAYSRFIQELKGT